ncbi:MAG: LysR family transcriptional regulator [Ideonella sp.]
MLNVKRLAVFRAVVQMGSVSAAARLLHISQPAVTKTIRLLESEVGLPLFLRVNGRLVLTPEAEGLVPEVERLFGKLAAVKNLADAIRDGFSGSISVAAVTTLTPTLVARSVQQFHQLVPRVRFDLRALSTRHVVDAVATHQVDVGIIDAPPSGVDMEVFALCRSEIGCVIRADHRLATRKRLAPSDLAKETLISYGEETYTGWQMRAAFQEAGVNAAVAFTVNHSYTAYALVQAGVGIGIVDSFPMLSGAYPDLLILPFRPVMQTRPHIVLAKDHPVSLIARKFLDVVRRTTEQLVLESRGMLKPPNG